MIITDQNTTTISQVAIPTDLILIVKCAMYYGNEVSFHEPSVHLDPFSYRAAYVENVT